MDLRALNVVLVLTIGGLFLASGTQREKSVLAAGHEAQVSALETTYAAHPDAASLKDLAQAYVDANAPGLAVSAVESAPSRLQGNVRVEHVYARALLDSGRAGDALAAEHKVLDACASDGCDAWLLASATRRADILAELVQLGIEDAQAHPEASAIAYHAATREARLAIR